MFSAFESLPSVGCELATAPNISDPTTFHCCLVRFMGLLKISVEFLRYVFRLDGTATSVVTAGIKFPYKDLESPNTVHLVKLKLKTITTSLYIAIMTKILDIKSRYTS